MCVCKFKHKSWPFGKTSILRIPMVNVGQDVSLFGSDSRKEVGDKKAKVNCKSSNWELLKTAH